MAAILAIERCHKNYSSTIVICYKELIDEMIKDGKSIHIDESLLINKPGPSIEDSLLFNVFLDSLTVEELEIAEILMSGEKLDSQQEIPESLKMKLMKFITIDHS